MDDCGAAFAAAAEWFAFWHARNPRGDVAADEAALIAEQVPVPAPVPVPLPLSVLVASCE